MRPAVAVGLLILVLNAASAGCSFTVQPDPAAHMQAGDAVDRPDQEVVLDDGDDVFARNPQGATGTAGEMLVAVGYVGWILAAAVLPLLLLF